MDSKLRWFAIATLAIAVAPSALAFAPPKPRKPAARPAKRVVLGTKQLSGDKAELGQMYTLGKTWPMNITLNSVEYSTDRLRFGDEARIPAGNEKFLVLHYTFHNPQSGEQTVRFDTFSFTAVDETDTNREGPQVVAAEATQQNLNMQLKPGQKVNAYSYIPVPAKGIVPKLIIKSSDNLVLRYDLRGKVKALKGPAADPADKDGAAALSEVPAQMGKTYQVGVFDVTLDSAAYSDTPLPDQELADGARNFIVNATVKNGDPREQLLRFDSITLKYADQDGMDINGGQKVLAASRNVDFQANLAFGKEVKVRFPVKVAKDQVVARMTISEGDNPRLFVFDMSGIK